MLKTPLNPDCESEPSL